MDQSQEETTLLNRAAAGDSKALGELLMQYQDRLTRIVSFRMDPRLKGRLDPTDIVQETYIDATKRFSSYSQNPQMAFFLWLRFLTLQKLAESYRTHFGVKARSLQREVSIYNGPTPQASSAVLAAQLLGSYTSPSHAAMRVEMKIRLEEKLNELEAIDREVLALRHFEQLSNAETAKVLEIDESAASSRYLRAVTRLKKILDQ